MNEMYVAIILYIMFFAGLAPWRIASLLGTAAFAASDAADGVLALRACYTSEHEAPQTGSRICHDHDISAASGRCKGPQSFSNKGK